MSDDTKNIPVGWLKVNEEKFDLFKGENWIGTDDSCNVVLKSRTVDSKHAVIEIHDPSNPELSDKNSKYGTKLRKKVVKPGYIYVFRENFSIMFGNVKATYIKNPEYEDSEEEEELVFTPSQSPELPSTITTETTCTAQCFSPSQQLSSSLPEQSSSSMALQPPVKLNTSQHSSSAVDEKEISSNTFEQPHKDVEEQITVKESSDRGVIKQQSEDEDVHLQTLVRSPPISTPKSAAYEVSSSKDSVKLVSVKRLGTVSEDSSAEAKEEILVKNDFMRYSDGQTIEDDLYLTPSCPSFSCDKSDLSSHCSSSSSAEDNFDSSSGYQMEKKINP